MSLGVPKGPPSEALLSAFSQVSSLPESTSYGAGEGEAVLREAVAAEMKVVYGDDVDVVAEDIAITTGANMAFVATVMCLADAGDEIILPDPWYFNHQMILTTLGIKVVSLVTLQEDGFIPSAERCASLITPRTKAIALVSPNNPTGAVYSPTVLESFAHLAQTHKFALIVDETYRDFVLPGPPHHLFSPTSNSWSWRSTLIHLFSFSKSYCIPGHRLGLAIASPTFLNAYKTVLDCLQICPPVPAQLALAPLLHQLREYVNNEASQIQVRHEIFESHLPEGWILGARGGYFAFVRHPWRGVSAHAVCERMAREVGVVVLPVEFFTESKEEGLGGWIRVSVANVDDASVQVALERLKDWKFS